jgi:ketosteroid isomerase-like protein
MSRPIRFRSALLPVALALVAFAGPALAAENPAIAAEVMALAKAQWAAQDQGKPGAQAFETVAADYTEFNPVVPVLVTGKDMSLRMYDAQRTSTDKGVFADMVNPHVQVYGDTAILTYNYAGMTRSSDGKVTPDLAKSTRVYTRQNGKWMLVHANFAPVTTPGN